MRLPEWMTRWLPGRAEHADTTSMMQGDHFDLEDIACDLCDAYAGLVSTGADRWTLARIITGLAGCALAQSYTGYAAWKPEDGEEGWTVPDTDKLSGFLLLEVAKCADRGHCYRPFGMLGELEPVEPQLVALAKAYADGPSAVIGERLYELGCAIGRATDSAAGEALMPLARAHGFCHDCSECREVAS